MNETITTTDGCIACKSSHAHGLNSERRSAIQTIFAFLLIFAAFGISAQEPTSVTRDRLNVHIKGLYTYNDNVFQTGNEQNDYLYTTFLGIDAEIGTRRIRFGLEGETRNNDFDEFDQQDDTSYDLNPRLVFGTGENLLTLGIFGEFLEEYKPVDETTIKQVNNHFDTGRMELTIRYAEESGIKLMAATTDAIYDKLPELDFFRKQYGISFFEEVTSKTTVGLNYVATDTDYDEAVRYDGENERYTFSIDYNATGKIIGHFEGGYESHKYDFSSGTVSDTLDNKVHSTYWDVSLAYSPTAKFDVEAGMSRKLVQGSSDTSNYYTETKPYLDIAFKPTQKLTAGIRSYFSDVDENNGFDSKKTGVEVKLNYAITNSFEIEAGHEYTVRDSDSPTGDFHRNVTTTGFVFRF